MTTQTEDSIDTAGGAQRLADAAGGIAEQATGVAEQRASTTMTQVGDTLEQVAQAVRDTGEQLRNDQPQVANVADTAADQVDHVAQYLREHDAREVLEGAQDFARRQPAVVIGAGLALGLLVGRAVKSAGPSGRRGSYGGRRYTDDDRAPYSARGFVRSGYRGGTELDRATYAGEVIDRNSGAADADASAFGGNEVNAVNDLSASGAADSATER